jgi:DNA recombination protein RmuC
MPDFIYLAVIVIVVGLSTAFIYLTLKKSQQKEPDSTAIVMLQNQVSDLTKALDSKLGESAKASQHQFAEVFKIVRDVTEGLVRLDETNKQVVNFTDQLKNLQDILKNPKQRGVLGEYYLDTVLKNILPPGQYQLQYKFEDGEIVDAVIFLKDKILSIDSKFSLENYNRIIKEPEGPERERLEKLFVQDIKNRIDETSKYIRPKEGTMDFAFMFIPSEAIYYDLLVNKIGVVKNASRDLIEYAFHEKHVIIVSPTSFMAYLQTVLQGLRALQIEESAKEIKKRVGDLGRHLVSHEEYMRKLGSNLGTTVSNYNRAHKELNKVDKDVLKISGVAIGVEPQLIEKPNLEE